ncbi:MAG TPA: hypothetical protein VGG11_19185 [Xanthobacteraceae bacterium]
MEAKKIEIKLFLTREDLAERAKLTTVSFVPLQPRPPKYAAKPRVCDCCGAQAQESETTGWNGYEAVDQKPAHDYVIGGVVCPDEDCRLSLRSKYYDYRRAEAEHAA